MKKTSILFTLLLSATAIFAQSPKVSFDHLNMRNGLSSDYVGGILQDEKGYIWMNASNSVIRYDGYHTKVYHFYIKDKSAFAGTAISKIFIYNKKRIIAGTYAGSLFRFDPALDSLVMMTNKANRMQDSNFYYDYIPDKQGNILALVESGRNRFYIELLDSTFKSRKNLVHENGARYLFF